MRNSRKERGIVDYEKDVKQLYARVLERMDKYSLTYRYRDQILRILTERMEQLEKENEK